MITLWRISAGPDGQTGEQIGVVQNVQCRLVEIHRGLLLLRESRDASRGKSREDFNRRLYLSWLFEGNRNILGQEGARILLTGNI